MNAKDVIGAVECPIPNCSNAQCPFRHSLRDQAYIIWFINYTKSELAFEALKAILAPQAASQPVHVVDSAPEDYGGDEQFSAKRRKLTDEEIDGMEVGLFFEELDALDGYTAEYDPSIPVHPADLPIEPEQQQGQEIQRNSAVDTAGIVIESDEDTMEPELEITVISSPTPPLKSLLPKVKAPRIGPHPRSVRFALPDLLDNEEQPHKRPRSPPPIPDTEPVPQAAFPTEISAQVPNEVIASILRPSEPKKPATTPAANITPKPVQQRPSPTLAPTSAPPQPFPEAKPSPMVNPPMEAPAKPAPILPVINATLPKPGAKKAPAPRILSTDKTPVVAAINNCPIPRQFRQQCVDRYFSILKLRYGEEFSIMAVDEALRYELKVLEGANTNQAAYRSASVLAFTKMKSGKDTPNDYVKPL